MLDQTGRGLHFRLYARAFVIEHVATGQRTVYMSADLCMIYQHVFDAVLEQLQAKFPGYYHAGNVLLHGTHTHSGPGGYAIHALYDVTTLGYHQQNFQVIVDGIVQAISIAHNNLSKGGRILINSGTLHGANANRGEWAYDQNPAAERAKYDSNVDKLMVLLRLQDETGRDVGMINFFAVHGTSMFNNNRLVSGDNKGYASYLFERFINGWNTTAGNGPFVAAFGQSNEGDVSPNTRGAFCTSPPSVLGQACEFEHSTCAGKTEGCQGQGPFGLEMFLNTQAIGSAQYEFARQLWLNATVPITASTFAYAKTYVDMSNVTVSPSFSISGKTVHTCPGGLGDAFAAGTTDGPGAFDFVEGTNSSNTNVFWNTLSHLILADPPKWVKDCQFPKRILLYTQGITYPCPWSASVLPLQLYQWGNFVLIGAPGEFTTMAGRRLRDTVKKAYADAGKLVPGMTFSIAGLSNSYSHYITTFEEFSVQRYAGGSTLYGPHTLEAYQQEFYKLAYAVATGASVPIGQPVPQCNKTFNFLPPVIEDSAPGDAFGSVVEQVNSTYTLGSVVNVTFWGSDLRNNLKTNSSYLAVQQLVNGAWRTVLTDADFETRLYWKRDGLTRSLVTCSWHIPTEQTPVAAIGSTYRLSLSAFYKPLFGDLKPYTGYSKSFTIVANK